ncbi:MAG: hypothetical protein Rsou_1073 [Candidatus Ruthia sp. Asou_11_S2]|nr:hypothetical protein [Candidatus Ruthia sp. Asou_11_S2]
MDVCGFDSLSDYYYCSYCGVAITIVIATIIAITIILLLNFTCIVLGNAA